MLLEIIMNIHFSRIVVIISLLCGSAFAVELINQHSCIFDGVNSLICKYKGEDVYKTDRTIKNVELLKFDRFGKGEIFVDSDHLPQLTSVHVNNPLISELQICLSIHAAETLVKVGQRLCRDINKVSLTTLPYNLNSNHMKSTQSQITLSIKMVKENHETKQNYEDSGKMQTLSIVITVLSVLLLVILLTWIKARISRMLEDRLQRKLYTPSFSGLSFSERIRGRRANKSRNGDSEV
ncbi:hypothetical protein ACF0H5_000073 [Mactra antiquata]